MEESQANNNAQVDAHEAQFLSAASKPTNTLSCPRCGNFVRELLPNLDACESCAEKLLPEGVRGPLSFSNLFAGALHLIKRIGPMALVITLAFELPGSVLFAFSPQLPYQLRLIYGFFTLVGDLLIMSMAFDALLGRPINMKAAFARMTSRYGAVLGARWISNVMTALGLLLLILPGIYVAVVTLLAAPIALFETHTGRNALTASSERTKGHWLLVAGTYGMPVTLGLAFAICVGVIAGVALEVEQESSSGAVSVIEPWLPYVSIATDIVLNFFTLLALFFQMVIYTKTWLALQAELGLDEPRKPVMVESVRTETGGRDALDAQLDAELSKLDD